MKLSLGTVQLGMPYGVANRIGQPRKQEALEMIRYAVSQGIELLDTAPGYGDSEDIIGQYLRDNYSLVASKHPFQIVTKIKEIDELTEYNTIEINSLLESKLKQSLNRLSVESVDYCLLHAPKNMLSHDKKVLNALKMLKQKELTKKIGVSVYSPVEVERFLELEDIDVIQVPINIFDLRLIKSGLLELLHKQGIEIHARSVYLQGLFMLSPQELPINLKEAERPLQLLRELSRKVNLTPVQLALLFVRDLKEINKILVGCESREQLAENIQAMGQPMLERSIREEILGCFENIPEYIINPSKWGR